MEVRHPPIAAPGPNVQAVQRYRIIAQVEDDSGNQVSAITFQVFRIKVVRGVGPERKISVDKKRRIAIGGVLPMCGNEFALAIVITGFGNGKETHDGFAVAVRSVLLHCFDQKIRDPVHALCIGMQFIAHILSVIFRGCRDAFQLHKGNTQQSCHCLQLGIGRSQIAIRFFAGQHTQAINLSIGIPLHRLMQHDRICLTDSFGFGIGIAVSALYEQFRGVNGCSGAPGHIAIGIVIRT